MAERIDAAEAAARLGVKPATLYSYVSRGLLTSTRDPAGRRSLFDAAEVAELHRRAHPLRAPGAELVIESAITALGADRPYYRGRDALTLAGAWTFEQTAEWLWTGVVAEPAPVWQAMTSAATAAREVVQALPTSTLLLDRVMLAVTVLAVSDPMRHSVDPAAVTATGRALIAGIVESLPFQRTRPVRPADRLAQRLWPRLTKAPPDPPLVQCLEAALVLLADHELAASTMAARIAASVKADPYAVVSSALGVVAGPMHGGASLGAERMLAEIAEPRDAAAVIGERLRRGERIPGAGHAVYKSGDRRADRLLDMVRAAVPQHPRLAVSEAVLHEMGARGLPAVNADFAIATLGQVCGMVPGAGEAIFAIARTSGWLAHALEEYTRTTPLRPRAVYVGTPIAADVSTSSSESS